MELVVGEDMEGAVICGVLCLGDRHGEGAVTELKSV